jgi:hypothetical protein
MSVNRIAIFNQVRGKQRGIALIIMLVILVVGIAAVLINSLTSSKVKTARQETTAAALAQAKDALIGDTVSQPSVTSAGYLRLPDIGFGPPGITPSEGNAAPNFSGNIADYSVIGKVPWKSLGISQSRDGQGECPWYVVSGHFKNTPPTNSALNWDTLGQIDVIDGNGSVIASNIAALLVAPGQPIDGQNRTLSDPIYTQCGGNYVARNYLDSYNSSDAVAGQVNYFTGSSNNRVALDTNNKQFVMTNNDHYNDHFLFVTTDDIFRPIIRRSDFSAQISALMNDPYFLTVTPSGTNKGADNVNCASLSPANQTFCNNWKEMLLITNLPTPSSITIDGAPTAACTNVLIFGGQKTAAQVRLTVTDKANSANYLEVPNLAAFAVPTATSNNFTGASTFNANTPSADLLKCIP